MARPKKCRRICREPAYSHFVSEENDSEKVVILSFEEYEVLRLIDYEKETQEQCAEQMNVSRPTVTDIYAQARFKLADYLVNGKKLHIEGGSYELCDGSAKVCYEKKCHHRNCSRIPVRIKKKGEAEMRIAVTYEDGMIFQHFGHTESFKIYDVEDKNIVREQVVSTNGSGHGALAGLLSDDAVDILICGGIGGGAQEALANAGIQLYGGVSGSADEAVKAFLAGTLGYNPDVHCDHHDHAHGEDGHTCGSHGCGNGSCH